MAHLIVYFPEEERESIEDEGSSDGSSGSFHFSTTPEDEFLPEDGDERAVVPLDPSLAGLHTYLGDCEDLAHSDATLEDGHICKLPVLTFPDVVVMPGCTLPLLVSNSRAHWVVEQALAAPAPYKCLIAVIFSQQRRVARGQIGCTALLRKLHREDNGIWPSTLKVIAEGCQRFEVLEAPRPQATQLHWDVRICSDAPTPRLPREAGIGAAHWAPWAWHACDAWALADTARRLFAEVAPEVAVLRGDPVAVGYWLARNLPVGPAARQRLLEAATPTHRLRAVLAHLRAGAGERLLCRDCQHEIGRAKDSLRITDEGPAGMFVNQGGYVHDLVALRGVRSGSVGLQGRPTTDCSWFRGYAWTIAVCAHCSMHLGWQFTSRSARLSPPSFYGLRRNNLSSRPVAAQGNGLSDMGIAA
ncbi:hypothetical protein WJX75_000490 [Coccomyxa subellipsoidea]|uniref:Protein cereblon n=1 Tax=Coccomyxa subellipsoidea TaxID=248742 RepID=A0ABR2YCT3_9CHLO